MIKKLFYTHNNIGDNMNYFTIFLRSSFFYILIAVLYRLMGKREVGELSIMDLVVSIFIAQIASIGIENYDKSIFYSLVPISVLVTLQIISSILELKSDKLRKVIDGEISIIINKGKIDLEEMEKQRYNLEDLLVELRSKGIKSIEEVDYAILETNGNLSIFKVSDDKTRTYPLPVIIDGIIQEDTLLEINKSIRWLKDELEKDNMQIDDIFYAFYKNNNLFLIKKDNV